MEIYEFSSKVRPFTSWILLKCFFRLPMLGNSFLHFSQLKTWVSCFMFFPLCFSRFQGAAYSFSHPLERYIALTLPTKICSTGVDCGMTRVTLLYLYDLEGWASPEFPSIKSYWFLVSCLSSWSSEKQINKEKLVFQL